MLDAPPLTNVRCLELAGLAPGPFAGLLLADYGATVLRVDRTQDAAHTNTPPPPTADQLTRHKTSICVDIKSQTGRAFIKALARHVDVIIDPFRPGVLEKLGLGPEDVLLKLNPRVIVARMTGYRREGKYAAMAGHDINYLAVSGVLGMLGRKGENPTPPGNILGDFAGGGAMCAIGILLALLSRERTGRGQVVEANMVDGAAYLATFPRLNIKTPMWSDERGTNILDSGSPFYDTYATQDGQYMSVGALEPQFFAALLKGLDMTESDLPGNRLDKSTWPELRAIFTAKFKTKCRADWESIFDGTDACVSPVLEQTELEKNGFDQRPAVTLKQSPGLAINAGDSNNRAAIEGQGPGVDGKGWSSKGLSPGVGGTKVLEAWTGWSQGVHYAVKNGGLELKDRDVSSSKL